MTLALYILAYAIIGLVIGRLWYSVMTRRDERVLAAMGAAIGIFWPLMLVLIPVCFVIVEFVARVIAPAIRWLFKGLDSAVNRIVPEKAD